MRSPSFRLLAPLLFAGAVVSACGSDNDTGLFQATGGGGNGTGGSSPFGKGGSSGSTSKGGSESDGGSTSKGGSGGKAGTSAKGGSGGKGGAPGKGGAGGDESDGGEGGSAGEGGSDAGAAGDAGADQGGMSGSAGESGGAGESGSAGKSGVGGTASGSGGASAGSGGTASGNGGSTAGEGGSSAGRSGGGGASAGMGGASAGTGGASAGAGGSGGNPYAGSTVPTTCEQAHGFPGCCGPDGKTVYFYEKGKLETASCSLVGEVCGWNATSKYYDCQPTPKADPSGKYPLICGGPPVDGACDAGGAGGSSGGGGANGDGIPETCSEAHGTFGCCVGDTLYVGNVLAATPQSCAATGQKCGWNNSTKKYACGTGTASDPTGTYTRACFGPFTGGGCLN